MHEGHVVVGVDGSPSSAAALRWALEVAGRCGAAVEGVHTWEWQFTAVGVALPDTPVELAVAARRTVEAEVEKAVADRPPGAPAVPTRSRAVEGDASTVLLQAVEGGRLLVLGRHGQAALTRRLVGQVLGSVAGHCLDRSTVPVAVVPADAGAQALRRVVVGVDGSPSSARALRWGAELGALVGAPVVAVLAWQLTTLPSPAHGEGGVPPLAAWQAEAEQLLADTVREALGADAAVEQLVLHAPAAAGLLGECGPDDVLVLGERGRGGFARLLLGSVSRQCAEHAPCPTVVVPSREAATT